jgi:osmoprotectant transport system permease protein
MNELLAFIRDPNNNFLGHTITYIQICVVCIICSTIIGVVLGSLVSRNATAAFIAVNISGLMRAIPVLAILILFVPYLGLGFRPTFVALVVLGIPPILLNTYTGVRGIDPAIITAAKGMGMTTWQTVQRIQAPIVLPVVAAGIRTAAIQIVATATLAGIIGAGGYGDYIIDGLNKLDNVEIFAGALPVTILAVLIELLLSGLQYALTPVGLRTQEQVGTEV